MTVVTFYLLSRLVLVAYTSVAASTASLSAEIVASSERHSLDRNPPLAATRTIYEDTGNINKETERILLHDVNSKSALHKRILQGEPENGHHKAGATRETESDEERKKKQIHPEAKKHILEDRMQRAREHVEERRQHKREKQEEKALEKEFLGPKARPGYGTMGMLYIGMVMTVIALLAFNYIGNRRRNRLRLAMAAATIPPHHGSDNGAV